VVALRIREGLIDKFVADRATGDTGRPGAESIPGRRLMDRAKESSQVDDRKCDDKAFDAELVALH
jgi:hypothetical protein